VVDRSSLSCVGSVFHARGAATEKAVSLIRGRVGGTTRSPDDEAGSADRAATSVTCRPACVHEATCGPSRIRGLRVGVVTTTSRAKTAETIQMPTSVMLMSDGV